MRSKHVKKLLSAYCNGELTVRESSLVSEHLLGCARCRAEYDQILLGSRLAGRLARVQVPETLWIQVNDALDRSQPEDFDRVSRWYRIPTFAFVPTVVIAALGLLIVAGVLILFMRNQSGVWRAERLSGLPQAGSGTISTSSRLSAGEWIETDRNSRVRLRPGSIGEIDVEPGSRLQLLKSRKNEYRLALERGELKARISAPPRLFFVDTPSATAVDLGCAYTLDVDKSGNARIEVTAGMVEFVAGGKESRIPSDAVCLTSPGRGPGTPYFKDASDSFKEALHRFDSAHTSSDEQASALRALLAQARTRDCLTLWHLLSRVDGEKRELVYRRLAALVPPPQDVTQDGVMRLDQSMLDAWFMETEPAWFR